VKKLLTAAAMVAMGAAATMTTVARDSAAGQVTPTKEDCITAWAILASGDAPGQEAVKNVVNWNKHWKSGSYVAGESQSFQLMTFDRTFGSGSVTVAHCGHGGTCNELANAVLKAWPNMGNPVVYCTVDPPHVLQNPQSL
jgi:hypothetical protein